MNTAENQDDIPSEKASKSDSNPEKDLIEEEEASEEDSKLDLDASGDHLPTLSFISAQSEDVISLMKKTSASPQTEEIGAGDQEILFMDPDNDQITGKPLIAESISQTTECFSSKTSPTAISSNLDLQVPGTSKMDVLAKEMPSFSISDKGSSSACDDLDSENQDEELVLKWDDDDDDDEDNLSLFDDNEMTDKTTMDVINQDDDLTEKTSDDTNVVTKGDDVDNITNEAVFKSTDDNAVDKISNDTITESKDADLADKIVDDAKAENKDNLTDEISNNTVLKDKDDVIDKIANESVSENNDAVVADTTSCNTVVESNESTANYNLESNNEIKESKDNIKKTVEGSIVSTEDTPDEDLLSELDAQIAELDACLTKAESEKLENINTSDSINSDHSNKSKPHDSFQTSNENITKHDAFVDSAKNMSIDDKKSKQNPTDVIEGVTYSDDKFDTKPDEILSSDENNEVDENIPMDIDSDDKVVSDEVLKEHENIQSDRHLAVKCSAKSQPIIPCVSAFTVKVRQVSEINKDIDAPITISDSDVAENQDVQEVLPMDKEISANSTLILDKSSTDLPSKEDLVNHDTSTTIEPREHGLNKPNMMLEIPTQELIDLDDTVNSTPEEDMSVDQINTTKNSHKDVLEGTIDLIEKENLIKKDTATPSANLKENNKSMKKSADCPILKESQQPEKTEENLDNQNQVSEALLTLPAHSLIETTEENIEKLTTELKENFSETDKCSIIDEKGSSEIGKIKSVDELSVKVSCLAKDVGTEDMDVCTEETLVALKQQETQEDSTSLEETVPSQEELKSTEVSAADTCLVSEDKDTTEKDSTALKEPSKEFVAVQPSTSREPDIQLLTSQMAPDISDAGDVPDVTDSLGLLAECSRVREDDDEQETSEHDDDDDDFNPDEDESSNQQLADQSEDSAQHSASDEPKQPLDSIDKDTDSTQDYVKDLQNELHTAAEEFSSQDSKNTEKLQDNENEESNDMGLDADAVGDDKAVDDVEDADMEIVDDIVCEEEELTTVNIGGAIAPTTEVLTDITLLGQDKTVEKSPEKVQFVEIEVPRIADADVETPYKTHCENQEKSKDDKASPSKTKNLQIANQRNVVSIVDLEESSSDDEIQEIQKPQDDLTEVTSVNISKEVAVTPSGEADIRSTDKETVITVPVGRNGSQHKPSPRLNTSEISIKTTSSTEPTLVIPETKIGDAKDEAKSKFGDLEVFNLDSDEDEVSEAPPLEPEPVKEKHMNKCINSSCTSDSTVPYYSASPSTVAYYESSKKKKATVCENCLYAVVTRAQRLVEGIKDFSPLLALEMTRAGQELVEISDSESEDEGEGDAGREREKIDADRATMLERDLADIINATWEKYKMDARLKDTESELLKDIERLEAESKEVNAMLDECQIATDKLRNELYASFEVEKHELAGLLIYDTPDKNITCPEFTPVKVDAKELNQLKRRLSSASESAPKKPAIPLGYSPLNDKDSPKAQDSKTTIPSTDSSKNDDDKDVSVVTLSAEAAPAELPPPGEVSRPALLVGTQVYAMRHAFGSWLKATLLEVIAKGLAATGGSNFTMCRVRFESNNRTTTKLLPARCLAYCEPSNVRMTIGTRVIALFKDTTGWDKGPKREAYYSGVVAEIPNPVNKYRYLVFFDDGYAQYVQHSDTRLVCEFSSLVWEEVHPFSREFVREYLLAYPERPMVRLHQGQSLKTEWNGKWWSSRVVAVDASLAQVYFEQDKRTEWIYRGSTRLAPLYLELQAAEKHRARPLPRNRAQNKLNMPYVEYTRSDVQDAAKAAEAQIKAHQEEMRRQRAVAKKSTVTVNPPPPAQPAVTGNLDAVTSRVVYYTPKNAVKPYKMRPHNCGPQCRRTDVLALKDLRTYNPLAKPLLSAWERQIIRYKGHKEVMYRAPCGRRIRNIDELHRYLRAVRSDMGVDLFHFGANIHCLAEFVLNKCIVGKKDLSHGKENVPVPCVNYYDESLPEFCSYNTERTPTAGVPLNLDPDFLCGCDCTDDCEDKSKCACWKMTLEGARTIGLEGDVGYEYKRLLEPLPSGIYECNVRCKCKSTCLNRVAQHPLQLKLQVFKTLNRGWGIRALNDVPKGSFLCIYAGNLLTDATANLDGLNEGDEYLAELDYIEVVEQMKEGFEDDIPEHDKKLDRKESGCKSESESESPSEEEDNQSKSDAEDGDFEPGYIPGYVTEFNKRLRKRDKKKQKEAEQRKKDKDGGKEGGNAKEDCITISDDEEIREPSSFAAKAGMGAHYISKHRSVRSHFGKDEACYIMDAKVQGNIGRYLNHSCSPNVFVQNVFVDTHDPRFPWVAFFALSNIRAGTELTWNYNYDVGSVPGKALYCYCGAPNCRGRLL